MTRTRTCRQVLLLGTATGLLLAPGLALAQSSSAAQSSAAQSSPTRSLGGKSGVVQSASSQPATAQPGARAVSSNAMVNLVRLLVAQGTITKDKGEALIAEAEQEAAQALAMQTRTAPAAAPSAAPASPQAQVATLAPPAPGAIRVPYIPEVVRNQIRDELRADVMKEARAQGWASPDKAAPDWTRGFKLYGDLRIRSQGQFYSRFNSTQFPNFQTIVNNGNAGSALDLVNSPIPVLNTTKDQYGLMRIRARLGADITVNPQVKVGIELASGNDSSPVSTNSALGGGFFKRNIYLYKAFVTARPNDWSSVTAGRMDNPFLASDLLFDPDLKFDGVAGEVKIPWDIERAQLRLRGGAFPLDQGNQNFPNTSETKTRQPQKWLLSGQIEGNYRFGSDTNLKLAVGYHQFLNVQGRPSAPCALYLGVSQCSTDGSTPFFVQKGNTLSFIRRIVLDPSLPSTTVQAQPQLLGLTMPYHVLDATGVLTLPLGKKTQVSLMADYVRNLAFKRSDVCRFGIAGEPVNNGGPTPTGGKGDICDTNPKTATPYVGGNQGFQLMATLGRSTLLHRGDWKAFVGYKYLESDAVLDAFTDDDFHLGGTNAKGFILGGNLALARGVTAGARWLSAKQITGDPLAIDVLQLDLSVAF